MNQTPPLLGLNPMVHAELPKATNGAEMRPLGHFTIHIPDSFHYLKILKKKKRLDHTQRPKPCFYDRFDFISC